MDEYIPSRVVEIDAAHRARQHPLDDLGDRLERTVDACAGSDLLEHAPLAGRDQLRALAVGDVHDAAADQRERRTRQAHQTHLAGNDLAFGVEVLPLEHGCAALHGRLDVAACNAEGRHAVSLLERADVGRAALQQFRPGHLEEVTGVLVAIHEAVGLGVEHDHYLGRVLDQHAITRFAVLERHLGLAALERVAHADDVDRPLAQQHLADQDLGRHQLAALVARLHVAGREVVVGVLLGGREILEHPGDVAVRREGRDQLVEGERQQVRLAYAEEALRGPVHALDAAEAVAGDDAVLDVVEDRLQAARALHLDLFGERIRLVGGDAHHRLERVAVQFERFVLLADQADQFGQLRLAVVARRLQELLLQQRMHVVRVALAAGRRQAVRSGRVRVAGCCDVLERQHAQPHGIARIPGSRHLPPHLTAPGGRNATKYCPMLGRRAAAGRDAGRGSGGTKMRRASRTRGVSRARNACGPLP